ncbi:bifunctional nicotinamidase/pyrazinamidase [Burkholderia cepacia]
MVRSSRREFIVAGAATLVNVAAASTPANATEPSHLKGKRKRDATGSDEVLIVVDVQNDFIPGGSLPVNEGAAVVGVINDLVPHFENIVLTQDWHPAGHISFASSHPGHKPFEVVQTDYGPQALWPDHCIQGTEGAQISGDLRASKAQLIIRKGYRSKMDSYSAFEEADHHTETGLAGYLRERGIRKVYVVGLATDFCVAWTAIDARKLGFESAVIEDATRAIDANGSLAKAWAEMKKHGVQRIQVRDIKST